MRDVGDRLQRDFRAVERAAAGGRSWGELFAAAIFALPVGLALVLAARRLLEYLLQLVCKRTHIGLRKAAASGMRRFNE
jgi:hypothetical protein